MAVVVVVVAAGAAIAAAGAVAGVGIAETAATAGSFSYSSLSASGADLRPNRLLLLSRFLRILAGIAPALLPARSVSVIHSFATLFWPSPFLQCTIAAVELAAALYEVLPGRFCVSVQCSALKFCGRNFARGYVFDTPGEDFLTLPFAWSI
jgi:hypothetical protein